MKAHPNRELTVLCGHTHGEGEAQILKNLRVLTGGAKYGVPTIQQVFEMGDEIRQPAEEAEKSKTTEKQVKKGQK